MNLILLFERDRVLGSEAVFRLGGGRARHAAEVLGARPGQRLRVGLLNGPQGTGEVVHSAVDQLDLRCSFDPEEASSPGPLNLVLAVPRPKSLKKLLPEIAALGVGRLILLRTWRVAKPYLSAHILEANAYRPLLHDGMMQARLTHEPEVIVEPLFKPFVEDRAATLFPPGAKKLVAHPGSETSLADVAGLDPKEPVVLAVGPEGGFIRYEVEAFQRLGFLPVSLGDRPLRVETATVAFLAQVALLRKLGENPVDL